MKRKRMQFEAFKNTQRHLLKEYGNQKYIQYALDSLKEYESNEWNAELLYTVALIMYICRVSNMPCPDLKKYDNLKLSECLYPSDVILLSIITDDKMVLTTAYDNSIPEFRERNIVENHIEEIA